MDLSKFSKAHNATTFEFDGSEWDILPFGHSDAHENLARKIPLSEADNIFAYFKAQASDEEVRAADYFTTNEELIRAYTYITAAHVTGWRGLSDGGKPVPYSFTTAVDVMTAYPAVKSWVDEKAQGLMAAKNADDDVTEAIKKKSRRSSSGKSSGDASENQSD